MSILADYLRRRRETAGEDAPATPAPVTPKRVGLAVAVAILGTAAVRRLRRIRRSGPTDGDADASPGEHPRE